MRKIKRHMGALLFLALVITTTFTADKMQALALEVDTSALEDKKQDTIDKIDDLKSDLKDIQNKVKELENSKSSLKNYIAKLDKEANALTAQIQELSDSIEAKKAEIAETQKELEHAQEVADRQYENMKTRIQMVYEAGTPSFLEMFLTSADMAEFLNKADMTKEMSRFDSDMLDQYIAQKEAVAEKKAQLEIEEEELELMSEAAEEQKAAVEAMIGSKTAEMKKYQSEIDSQESEASDYEKEIAEQERLLSQIEDQIAAAAAANGRDDDGDGGASGFVWPCPSSHRITSNFGPRPQPTPGASTNHKGIDIGAAHGAAIVASAGGRVTTSTYSNSAGNYIVISHGNGLSTVYMHCSALYVSVGDTVERGETIAAVGSTGYSTGPHLHFGVMKNGVYVNPRNYV